MEIAVAKRLGAWTPNIVRERMRVSALVRRLQKFALGEKDDQGLVIEMSPAQVTATLGLLKKTLPDLSSVELSGEVTQRHVKEMTEDELERIAAGGSAGNTGEAPGPQEPPAVH